jgi:hypothetical protein
MFIAVRLIVSLEIREIGLIQVGRKLVYVELHCSISLRRFQYC